MVCDVPQRRHLGVLMYYPTSATFVCDVCEQEKLVLENPGKYGMSVLAWKAQSLGWQLGSVGKHLGPECRKKLFAKAGIPEDWVNTTPAAQIKIQEISQLPWPNDPPT